MSKRKADDNEEGHQAPLILFPEASDYPFNDKFVFRDNSMFLRGLGTQALFLRPTQMGKSSFFALANRLYNKKLDPAQRPQVQFLSNVANTNTMYVFDLDFLLVGGNTLEAIDASIKRRVQQGVAEFVNQNKEIHPFYLEPHEEALCGEYLERLAIAVADYGSSTAESKQSLLVLVDEYDKPVREILVDLIGTGDDSRWETVKTALANYRSFFSSCKAVTSPSFLNRTAGMAKVCVWVTGVLPIALRLISDFTPENHTFRPQFAAAFGLCDSDVDSMLDKVHQSFPFQNDQEKSKVRNAIKQLASRLYFGEDTPLYHTRVVNGIMNVLMSPQSRFRWLQNTSKLPRGVQFQEIPASVFDVVRRQHGTAINGIARSLSFDEEIVSTLNESLNLADVLRNPVSVPDYLTLLVHLGICSVREKGDQMVFNATSTYFRAPFFQRLLENALQPLLEASTLDELYKDGEMRIHEFMTTLPKSGMSSMIRWADQARSNNSILELQFQGFLIGELVGLLWNEEVATTQEDRLDCGRTDVRIAGERVVLQLELKQKANQAEPTEAEMTKHHAQLFKYVKELTEKEKRSLSPRLVAGFVVVMFNNRKEFTVKRTTYGRRSTSNG